MDAEEIKKKKIMELMKEQQEQSTSKASEEEQLQQQIRRLEIMLKQWFTKKAWQRYNNLKLAYPQKAMQVIAIIASLLEQGQIKEKIDDERFKDLLKRITPKKRVSKIKRV